MPSITPRGRWLMPVKSQKPLPCMNKRSLSPQRIKMRCSIKNIWKNNCRKTIKTRRRMLIQTKRKTMTRRKRILRHQMSHHRTKKNPIRRKRARMPTRPIQAMRTQKMPKRRRPQTMPIHRNKPNSKRIRLKCNRIPHRKRMGKPLPIRKRRMMLLLTKHLPPWRPKRRPLTRHPPNRSGNPTII